jgi:8-oxo-dGTP diphosphatase
MKRARNSAKVAIIKDDCLSAIDKNEVVGDCYILPGGGQQYYETLADAVKREVKEETTLDVKIGELIFIREYINDHHEFVGLEPEIHQVDFMFPCQAEDMKLTTIGDEPDSDQIGIKWLRIIDLMNLRLYLIAIRHLLLKPEENRSPIYLGDIN